MKPGAQGIECSTLSPGSSSVGLGTQANRKLRVYLWSLAWLPRNLVPRGLNARRSPVDLHLLAWGPRPTGSSELTFGWGGLKITEILAWRMAKYYTEKKTLTACTL